MRPFIGLILLFLLGLSACEDERSQKREMILGLEHAIVQNPTDEFVRPLVAGYLDYYSNYEDDEMTPVYLYRCAVVYFRAGNQKEAAVHLETILRKYPESEVVEDTYLFLAMIMDKYTHQKDRAKTLYETYLETYPNGKGLVAANNFFRPAEEKTQENIDDLLRQFSALPRGQQPSESLLSKLMFAYAQFVKQAPDHPLAAAYCLQGAKLANRLSYSMITIQFLDKIYRDYPDFQQYPEAVLMLAVEYDTNISLHLQKGKVLSSPLSSNINIPVLRKMDLIAEGGRLYREILERYPDHEVADSARTGLKFLGKTSNAVVEEFIRVQDSIKAARGY